MSALNLQVGEHVHYGTHGVCRVCGLERRNMGGSERMYFTLRPTGRENILLYLPQDAEPEKVRVRRLLSRQEIMDILDRAESIEADWISDSKLRRETFTRVLRSGDAALLLGMLKCIHNRQEQAGKPLPMSDQEMMHAAQRQLYSEMAHVLEMDESQVLPFILSRVNAAE